MNSKVRTKLPIKHPGEVFRTRFLERYNLNTEVAANKLHMKREQLSRFLNGHTSVSKALALKLEVATNVSAKYWLSRQLDYDAQQLEHIERSTIDAEPLLESL